MAFLSPRYFSSRLWRLAHYLAAFFPLLVGSAFAQLKEVSAGDSDSSIELSTAPLYSERIKSLVAQMTLEEKAGQLAVLFLGPWLMLTQTRALTGISVLSGKFEKPVWADCMRVLAWPSFVSISAFRLKRVG